MPAQTAKQKDAKCAVVCLDEGKLQYLALQAHYI
jgi:hypothetical protein